MFLANPSTDDGEAPPPSVRQGARGHVRQAQKGVRQVRKGVRQVSVWTSLVSADPPGSALKRTRPAGLKPRRRARCRKKEILAAAKGKRGTGPGPESGGQILDRSAQSPTLCTLISQAISRQSPLSAALT